MALPVKPSDWQSIIASTGASLCTRLKLLLNNIGQYLYNYMSWMWQEDGELTDEAAEVISRKVSGVRSGTIMFMAVPQASIPSGYLLCDGRSLDKTVTGYADLYAAIGTRWGGDGDPNFNIPNLLEDIPYGAKDDTELGQEVERAFLSHSADIFVATGTKNITITDFITLNAVPYYHAFFGVNNVETSQIKELSHEEGFFVNNVLKIPHGLNFSKLEIKTFLVITKGDSYHEVDVGEELEITTFPWLVIDGDGYYSDTSGSPVGRTDYKISDIYYPHSTWQTDVFHWGYNYGNSDGKPYQKTAYLLEISTDSTNINIGNPFKDFRFMYKRINSKLIAQPSSWPKIEADLRIEITNKSLFDNAYSLLTTHGLTPVIKL